MVIDKGLMQKLDNYQVIEVKSGIFWINDYNLSSVYLITGKTRALVIDCGTGVGDLKGLLDALTALPYDVVITHGHVDHIGGRGQFERLYVSEKDAPLVPKITRANRYNYNLRMKFVGYKGAAVKKSAISETDKEPELIHIKESETFSLGGRTVKTLETPGHTKGSLSFHLLEDDIIFSGDIFNPNYLMFLSHTTSVEELLDTYLKLYTIACDTFYASHLSYPLNRADLEKAIALVGKVLKKRDTFLPLIKIASYKGFSMVYKSREIHKSGKG